MNVRHPMSVLSSLGVLHAFSIKNIFYDKLDLRRFYFDVTNFCIRFLRRCLTRKGQHKNDLGS